MGRECGGPLCGSRLATLREEGRGYREIGGLRLGALDLGTSENNR